MFDAYLEGMAEVAGIEGQPERLVQLFGAAVPLRSMLGIQPDPTEQAAHTRRLLAAHTQLGEGVYNVAWEAGQTMTLEQALAKALNS